MGNRVYGSGSVCGGMWSVCVVCMWSVCGLCVWSACGPCVVCVWSVCGPCVVRVWSVCGPCVVHVSCGPHVVRMWSACGPHVVRVLSMWDARDATSLSTCPFKVSCHVFLNVFQCFSDYYCALDLYNCLIGNICS